MAQTLDEASSQAFSPQQIGKSESLSILLKRLNPVGAPVE